MVDATLETLVPQTSTRRRVLVGLALLLAVAWVWFGRPAIEQGYRWDSAQPVAGGEPFLVSMWSVRPLWPGFVVLDVADVPGAEAVGVWAVPMAPDGSLPTLVGDRRGPVGDDPAAWLASTEPMMASARQAPVRLDAGRTVAVVTLWRITDCSALARFGTETQDDPLAVNAGLRATSGFAPVTTVAVNRPRPAGPWICGSDDAAHLCPCPTGTE